MAPSGFPTLSLHDALPISSFSRMRAAVLHRLGAQRQPAGDLLGGAPRGEVPQDPALDRKSTRLNSSHQIISYAVFCLKTKILLPLRRIIRSDQPRGLAGST